MGTKNQTGKEIIYTGFLAIVLMAAAFMAFRMLPAVTVKADTRYSIRQMRFMGDSDYNFANVIVMKGTKKAVLTTAAVRPNKSYEGTYLAFTVADKSGREIYEKTYEGTVKQESSREILKLGEGYTLNVYAAEAGHVHFSGSPGGNLDNKLQASEDSSLVTYTMQSDGTFVKTNEVVKAEIKNLKVTTSSYRAMNLSWEYSGNAVSFLIYRSESENGIYKMIDIVSAKTPSYTDKEVSPDTAYYYKVGVYYNGEEQTVSDMASSRTKKKLISGTPRALVLSGSYDGAIVLKDNVGMEQLFLKYGYETKAYHALTVSEIKAKIADTFKGATKDDTSYIYINCHGDQASNLYLGTNGTISMAVLRNELDKIPGMKVLMIESCFSGNAVNLSADEKESSTGEEKELDETDEAEVKTNCDALVQDFLYPEGAPTLSGEFLANNYKVLCASSKTQESWAWTFNYAWATYNWGLSAGWNINLNKATDMQGDANKDSSITLSEMYNFSYPRVYNTGVQKQQVVYWPSGDNTCLFQE